MQASPINSGTLRPNHSVLVYRIYQESVGHFLDKCWSESGLFDCPCWALKASQALFHLISRLAVMLKPRVALRVSGHGEACSWKCADKHGLLIHQRPVEGAPESSTLRELLAFGREGLQVAMGNTCAGVSGRAACVGRGRRDCTTARRGRKSQEGGIKSCCILGVYCCKAED